MTKSDISATLGDVLKRARQRRGYSQRRVAEGIGVSTAAVGQWEIGANLPKTENLIKLAQFLKVDGQALSQGRLVFAEDDMPSEAGVVTDWVPPPTGPHDIERLGTSLGGEGDGGGHFKFNGEVLGYVQRPPGITHLRKVFAIDILGDSMVPRFKPGEMVYCGGRDPIPGDDVVVELFPEVEGDTGCAYIKNLVRRTPKEIIVEQYNPPKQVVFDRYAVKHIWRVIPLKELLGY